MQGHSRTSDEILAILRSHREELQQRGVKSLSIFGSVARGEAGSESDVDLLVELDQPIGLFSFVRLQHYLEGLLGRSVDLVTREALRESLKDRILQEAIRAA